MSIPFDTSYTEFSTRSSLQIEPKMPTLLDSLLRAMVAMAVVPNAWEETYKLLKEPLSLVSRKNLLQTGEFTTYRRYPYYYFSRH